MEWPPTSKLVVSQKPESESNYRLLRKKKSVLLVFHRHKTREDKVMTILKLYKIAFK